MTTEKFGTVIFESENSKLNRNDFLKRSVILFGGFALAGINSNLLLKNKQSPLFKISLAEWSLHRSIRSGKIDHLDFSSLAKNDFGISAVEYVNTFFFNKAKVKSYLKEMKTRANDLNVESLLIMCDNEGNLGDPNKKKRDQSVENHYKWIEAAKFLGCHSIRVNARSEGNYNQQIELASDGLRRLAEFGDTMGINTIVENHGGLSSNGKWLSEVMKKVDHPRIGTLPDFGNFRIDDGQWYDRYQGVQELMPFATAVSAKSHKFNSDGNETETDYYKMMKIVLDAGYNGYVGIEYEGNTHNEMDGIRLTLELLKKVRNLFSNE